MYVLFGVVAPPCVAAMYVLVGEKPPPCDACYVCADWRGGTPLCYTLGVCWLVWCHPIVLPAIYVLVGVVPPSSVAGYVCSCWCGATHCIARYVCAGWCGATPLCCVLCLCWFVWCHPFVLPLSM